MWPTWTADAKGATLTFRGALSEGGFRQIVTLLVPPPPQLEQGQVESNNPLAGEIRLQASQRYFQLIQKKIEGLKKPPIESRTRVRCVRPLVPESRGHDQPIAYCQCGYRLAELRQAGGR